uniref:CUE domain-containing protein n=1 Tax=Periophthalmus magnuspinnatus TaxID=409849 RepID=A0A3B4AYS2_9GOBI
MAGVPVPLDEHQVTEFDSSGLERTLPALHPKRITERLFLPYTPPPAEGSVAELEEFLEQARFITEDLEWLLALPHDLFWCQVVFDESLQRCLDSYLQLAPRSSDVSGLPSSPALAEVQSALHRAVFMTFLRMATYKESKVSSVHSTKIIKLDFDSKEFTTFFILFILTKLKITPKLFKKNIFTQQPSYYNDLEEAIPTVGIPGKVVVLPSNSFDAIYHVCVQELSDLLVYLCDSTSTIHAFLEIFPQACSSFYSHGFISRLSSFYESAVPELEKAARKATFDDKGLLMELWLRLSHSCRRIVDTVHLLLHHTCLQPILEGGDNIQKCAEELLQNFTSFLPEKRFLCDYNEQFPIVDDISLLQQALPLIDETRTSYLLQGVQSAVDSIGTRRLEAPVQKREDSLWTLTQQAQKTELQPEGQPKQQAGGQPAAQNSDGLESLLSSVKDLLPDLGEGFLLACLEEYDYNSAVVINNILEERLSPSLSSLDRSMPRVPSDPLPELLDHRSNVFDDDEFDIFRRNQVDMSRIWKGRRKGESAKEMLNDKRHIEDQRKRYQSYETVVDEVSLEPGESLDYEDEYDDTYDMNQVGANDLDQDSLLRWRYVWVGGAMREACDRNSVLNITCIFINFQNNVQRDQFVQDPAVLRERAEARRAAMQQRRGYRPERPSHVVGQPKGQGQSQETVLDRRKKESNKSRGANHNRRSLADRKKNKGMIPI